MGRLGQARESWAELGRCGRGVERRSCAPRGRLKMIMNRLYGSMCESRAEPSSPLSCQPARYAHTSQGFGLGAAHDGLGGMHAAVQAKHCSESTCRFQVAEKGASTSSGTLKAALGRCGTVPFSLTLRIFPALPASTARLEARGGQIRNRDKLVKCC